MSTDEKIEEVKKTSKRVKKETIRLMGLKEQIPATYWTIHLHRMIKEANPTLLKQSEVIKAFNHLVDVLLEDQRHVHSYFLRGKNKYKEGVDLDANPPDDPLKGICAIQLNSVYYHEESGRVIIRNRYYRQRLSPDEIVEQQAIYNRVVEAYRPLYHLIRDTVIPYMNRAAQEVEMKERQKRIQKIMLSMERESNGYDLERKRRELLLSTLDEEHQTRMNHFRRLIAHLSESS